ncbi:sensor histidine kinase [Cryptosporangium phraense]|uniref:histidine kinase n=1 Tax=Cryptosporangium phraense TaxID=2593070 RepID=A0A545AY23_9ACTN|nr:sensor histidine kinase [Cryptosporangium phraense]
MHAVLTAPFTRRAWAEAGYCLLSFPVGLVGFGSALILLALGVALTASVVGAGPGLVLAVLALGLSGALAALQRALAARLLADRVAAPARPRPADGFFARLDARLRDEAAWRATAYGLVKVPVAVFQLYAAAWWLIGVFDFLTPLRWLIVDPADGELMRTISPFPGGAGAPHSAGFAATFITAGIGVVTLLAAPWFTRAVVAVDRWLVRVLLGPGELAQRVRNLEETRALAVEDSAARLRRLERDLHDGAQVRLVALAMSLSMAAERLGPAGGPVIDPDRARELVRTAHRSAGEVLSDLRNLSRGIHPPVLDEGLADALATLCAGTLVPVELSVDLPRRPSPAIESIAYFCVAELLANVIKHSGAGHAVLRAEQRNDRLQLLVSDDGHGGAEIRTGTGLPGLAQRVRTVDGSLRISSPPGGPTAVEIELPLHA